MDSLEKFLLVLFEGLEGYVYTPARSKTGEWRQQFYHWPEEQEQLYAWIRVNGTESDIYISPSIFNEKSARKQSVRGAQVSWVEFDGQEHINLDDLPSPNLIVQTSVDTHQHIYWRIPFSSTEVVESINRRLTYGLHADTSGWDANQVLRPPLTVNFKHNLPVQLLGKPHRNYIEPAVFDRYSDPPQLVSFEDIASLPLPVDVLSANPLPKKIFKMMSGASDIPEGVRSTFLMHLGYELAEAGLQHEEIVSLLLVADEKVGKFHGRSDRLLRLAEISSIAICKSQGNSEQSLYSFKELLDFQFSIKYIWGDILNSKGSVLFAGEPGIGKTQFAFNVASSICLGQSFLAGSVPEPQRVIFFSLEMNALGCKYILANQAQTMTPEQIAILAENFFIVPRGYSMSTDEIEQKVKLHEPNGIFIDTMSETARDKLTDEAEARRIVTWDAMLRNEMGIFSWWNHHTRKANGENKAPTKVSDIYGSFLYAAKMESIMIMHGSRGNKGPIKLIKPKIRYGVGDKEGVDIERTEHLTFKLKNAPGKEIDVDSPDAKPTEPTSGLTLDF